MTEWFNVGKIVNTHGIKGEVRIVSRTDFADERYKPGNTLFLFMNENDQPIPLEVESRRVHKTFDLLKFVGKDNVNEVEQYKGAIVKVPATQLEDLNEGEFYFHEIIGCKVINLETNDDIGVIKEILTPGANDVWVIKGSKGKEILIPYIDQIVKEVNIADKVIYIEPMEGLL
ncbi:MULTISPECIES: ribosome maturation factor RimM [Bacillus]|uniref:ribosome maturation factor RimM n=1 Tax=Bacillus TaxID=1386 RepID=UPI000BB88328|nr:MULTISPECIES: ribosome maturation factor RimM [Bacillus]